MSAKGSWSSYVALGTKLATGPGCDPNLCLKTEDNGWMDG